MYPKYYSDRASLENLYPLVSSGASLEIMKKVTDGKNLKDHDAAIAQNLIDTKKLLDENLPPVEGELVPEPPEIDVFTQSVRGMILEKCRALDVGQQFLTPNDKAKLKTIRTYLYSLNREGIGVFATRKVSGGTVVFREK